MRTYELTGTRQGDISQWTLRETQDGEASEVLGEVSELTVADALDWANHLIGPWVELDWAPDGSNQTSLARHWVATAADPWDGSDDG